MSGASVGGDIRLAIALRDHRKVKRLRRLLGGQACWSLVCLWLFAGNEHWDGDLSGLADEDIEEEARWEGEPGAFIEALLQVRFLSGRAGARQIHDWAEHQPFASQRGLRAEAARRAANARWAQVSGDAAPSGPDAGRMPPACDGDAGVMPPTQPNPTVLHEDLGDPSRAPAHEPPGDGAVLVGSFEPAGEAPRETPNPVAAYAIALNGAGFRCTAMNPKLIAFAAAGGSVDHLLQVAALDDCKGKPAGYVAGFALREHLDGKTAASTALVPSTPQATPKPGSKTAAGLAALEGLK